MKRNSNRKRKQESKQVWLSVFLVRCSSRLKPVFVWGNTERNVNFSFYTLFIKTFYTTLNWPKKPTLFYRVKLLIFELNAWKIKYTCELLNNLKRHIRYTSSRLTTLSIYIYLTTNCIYIYIILTLLSRLSTSLTTNKPTVLLKRAFHGSSQSAR